MNEAGFQRGYRDSLFPTEGIHHIFQYARVTFQPTMGSIRRVLWIVGAIALLVFAGGAVATGSASVPAVKRVDNSFAGVTETSTTIDTDIVLVNPYPFGVTFQNLTLSYTVDANGVALAHGVHRGLHIGTGTTAVDFTTRLRNERISRWWVTHIRRGERTTVTLSVGVNPPVVNRTVRVQPVSRQFTTDMLAAFESQANRPVETEALTTDYTLVVVRETHATWGSVSQTRTPVRTDLVVYNPHPYPVVVSELSYDIRMNDVQVGHGSTEKRVVIPPHATRTLDARTVIRNEQLDEWWVTHIQRGQVTTLRVEYYLTIDPSAPGIGAIRVPLETMKTTVTTDFFGGAADSSRTGHRASTRVVAPAPGDPRATG